MTDPKGFNYLDALYSQRLWRIFAEATAPVAELDADDCYDGSGACGRRDCPVCAP